MSERRGILKVSKRLLAEALGSRPDEDGELPWKIEFVITEKHDIFRHDYIEFVVSGAGCMEIQEGQVIPDVIGMTSAEYGDDGRVVHRETKLRVA